VSYQIDISASAQKEVKSLPGHVRAQARQLIRTLSEEPRPARAKELRGKPNLYRIWLAGYWRIVYRVEDDLQLIQIIRVRRKEEIDYENVNAE
jgi:mRNA-degrading endonuclease RelE of RelBE toxin-antitoxin system